MSTMLPKLSRPQAKVLAYWSYGMVLARSCGITLVCVALALQVDSSEQSLLQRPADQPRLALALDATTLKKRFTVLVISVVYRGCAIPVAWKVVGAEQKGAWEPHWLKLLEKLEDRIPPHWTVIVMSDRGLYAPWLYAKIVSLGWHPFMRINKQGNFRPQGEGKFRSLSTAAPEVGSAWCGQVDCFSGEVSRLQCTL
ncbi:MAG: endonuclease, partial [Chloroflexi bacterium]